MKITTFFQIMQLKYLSRANHMSSDHHITKSFDLLLGALIASAIPWAVYFIYPNPNIIFFGISKTLLTIWGYKALVKFVEGYFSSSSIQKVHLGFRLYSTWSYISIGLTLISSFAYLLILGVNLIVSIIALMGQVKLANSFLEISSHDVLDPSKK